MVWEGYRSRLCKCNNFNENGLFGRDPPEQISKWLKIQYPDDESMRASHETIYRSLFIQARGVLKKELLEHLRSKRRIRGPDASLDTTLETESW
jgi:IS30 family transposase